MKLHAMLLVLVMLFGGASPVLAKEEVAKSLQEINGLEWLQLSITEREEYVLASMTTLAKNEVELVNSPDAYYTAVETKIRRNPNLYNSPLTDILASCVYDKEPKARPKLDQFRESVIQSTLTTKEA